MPVQMRLSQGDGRLYSPDRDLAYCTPHMVMQALRGLDPDNQEEWVRQFLTEHNVTNDDLVEGAVLLAKYLNTSMLDPQYPQPYDALKAIGFFDLPQPVITIICAKLGQVLLSSAFVAIRDVTRDPTEPPFNAKAIEAAANDTIARIKGKRKRWFW